MKTQKQKEISKMKKIPFCSIIILFVLNMIQQNVSFIIPHFLTMIFALGIWWGGLGWLWAKYKFRRVE